MDPPLTAIRHDQTCEICMRDDRKSMMEQSCGHLLCSTCEFRLSRYGGERPSRCPFCRKFLEIKTKRVYKGQISCHICQKLKNCEEIWWCGECRSLLCSDCQLKTHGVSNKSHEIELFSENEKTEAAIVASDYLESRSNAAFSEDTTNYAHDLQYFLAPVVQKIADDKANVRKEKFLELRDALGIAFGSRKRKERKEERDENPKSFPPDAVVFEQISKLGCFTAPAPVSLPSQGSYFVAAEVKESTMKILVESLKLSHFNIVGDCFTIVRQNKIFLGKLPEFHSSPVKIPALTLLYELKDQTEDLKGFELENRFTLTAHRDSDITCAVLTRIKSDCPKNNQWKLSISHIPDPQTTIQDDDQFSGNFGVTDIAPTDSALGKVTGMKVRAPRQLNPTSSLFGESFYVLLNCENGSEIFEVNDGVDFESENGKHYRSIHRASDNIQTFASLHDRSLLLKMAMVYSGDENKVITFELRDTTSESDSTDSDRVNDQNTSGMDQKSFSFPGPVKSLDFATWNKKESRLVIRTEDGDVFFMLDSKDPASEPRKRLSLKENAKLSPVNRTMYAVLDEETGMMRMVILM